MIITSLSAISALIHVFEADMSKTYRVIEEDLHRICLACLLAIVLMLSHQVDQAGIAVKAVTSMHLGIDASNAFKSGLHKRMAWQLQSSQPF